MLINNHTIIKISLSVMKPTSGKRGKTALLPDLLTILVFVQGKDNFTPLNFIAH